MRTISRLESAAVAATAALLLGAATAYAQERQAASAEIQGVERASFERAFEVRVKPGDTLHALLMKRGIPAGGTTYGAVLFLNPSLRTIHEIGAGDTLTLPTAAMLGRYEAELTAQRETLAGHVSEIRLTQERLEQAGMEPAGLAAERERFRASVRETLVQLDAMQKDENIPATPETLDRITANAQVISATLGDIQTKGRLESGHLKVFDSVAADTMVIARNSQNGYGSVPVCVQTVKRSSGSAEPLLYVAMKSAGQFDVDALNGDPYVLPETSGPHARISNSTSSPVLQAVGPGVYKVWALKKENGAWKRVSGAFDLTATFEEIRVMAHTSGQTEIREAAVHSDVLLDE